MDRNPFSAAVRQMKEFFDRSTATLGEDDGAFAPVPGMFTAAQQVAHVAQSVDWFLDGAFLARGFDLDFAALDAAVRRVASLAEARAWLDRSVARAVALLEAKGPADMAAPIAAGPVMGGAPRSAAIAAMTEHTAHHRGALTVYARLRGQVPAMPYG
jgi:uncharacterized damage-inducible protein DinB